MAIVEIPKRDIWTTMIRKKPAVNLLSFSKISSSLSSFSIPSSPPSTPLHPFSESMMEENIDNSKSMIEKWDPHGSVSIKLISLFQENRKSAEGYLECIKGLHRAMHFLVSEDSCSNKLVLAQHLMQISMKQLQKEFYQILSTKRKYLDPELVSRRSSRSSLCSSNYSEDEASVASDDELWLVGDSISNVDQLSFIAMSDLRSIADCMIRSGYGRECVNIYKLIRKSIVEEGLYRLGIKQYSSSQINKMSSEVSEETIQNWLNATQTAVKTLFYSERFLCDHVFAASEIVREKCFTMISKEGAINLFKFPELVAKRKRSPEKIFQLMDLYKTISNLLPEIDSIFSYESLSAIRLQVLSSLHKLGKSVQTMFSEFESSIQRNSTKVAIPGGGIHPLNTSAMTYLQFLANYSGVLTEIIADSPFPGELKLSVSSFDSPNSKGIPIPPVSMQLAWIILVLQCKLDSKAKLYNNIALSYLCLANNLQFIVKKVRTTNLKYLLGEEWVLKHERKVKQYAANYEAIAWNKVLLCLPDNSAAAMSAETVKGCIKQFKSVFEAVCLKQILWVVTDRKLQDEIRLSIAKKLVPAYRELYKTYLEILRGEENLEVVMLKPDDLSNYLSHLFNGGSLYGSSLSSYSLSGVSSIFNHTF